MHGADYIELLKLPDNVDGWKIQPALDDATVWMHASMHASKNNTHPRVLPWLDDFVSYFVFCFVRAETLCRNGVEKIDGKRCPNFVQSLRNDRGMHSTQRYQRGQQR